MGSYSGVEPNWAARTNTGRTHIATKGIVQSGLILNLDAGLTSSYSGIGTTWTDLSGNGNNGILQNDVGFSISSNSNGGSMVFNGVDNYVNVGNLGSFFTQGTISYWMNSSAVENYRNTFSTHYLGGNMGIRFEQYTSSIPLGGFNVVIGNDSGTYGAYGYSPTASLTQGAWYNVVLVWNTSTSNVIGYLNGAQRFNTSHNLWPTTLPSISIGSGYNSSRYFRGVIPSVHVYNKALSEAEVSQNFNALRGRYGV